MTILRGNKRFDEFQFNLEDDFEELICAHSKTLFGKGTIFICAKRKLKGLVLGDAIPDGFLLDLTDLENPEFCLVEVELQSHDFRDHIFPQLSKFLGFIRNPESQKHLVENLYSIIKADPALKREFKKALGEQDLYKFLKDICEESHKLLLVIDGDKKELQEAIHPYAEIWREQVKILTVKKFTNGKDSLILVGDEMTTKPEKWEKKSIRQQYKGQRKMAFIYERLLRKGGARMTKSAIVSELLKAFPGSNEKTTKASVSWAASAGLRKMGKVSNHLPAERAERRTAI
jgi:hypothetical protein